MARQIIDLGTLGVANSGEGLRLGGDKINDNFAELYTENEAICRVHDLTFAIPSGWWDSGHRVTVTSLLSSTSSFAIICNWSPLVMYAGDLDGSLWDISEAGTGVTWGDSVSTVQDLSGNDNDATQPNVALRPDLGRAPLGSTPSATLDGGSGPAFLRFDLSDDVMPTSFADGGTYDVFVAGRGGSWIERDVVIAPGADLDIGPSGVAGRNAGILSALGGNPGNWADIVENGVAIVEGTIDPDHLAWLVKRAKANGAKGLLVPGPELVVNGTFDTDVSGWTAGSSTSITWNNGTADLSRSGPISGAPSQLGILTIGRSYLVSMDVNSATGGTSAYLGDPQVQNEVQFPVGTGFSGIQTATGTALSISPTGGNNASNVDNISVRELIAEQDL